MNFELLIQNANQVYMPVIEEGISWSTERKGVPGTLAFNVLADSTLNITEGNGVRLKVNDVGVFYGFIFIKKTKKDGVISITAYDQLRYLKNKDTYVYENKKASEVIQMLARDFELQTGIIEDTGYIIPTRTEQNATLFDITQTALDLTLQHTKEMFVLFDDFGSIALKNISSMMLNLLIDEETGENFDYTSSIDSATYNKVKLSYDNEETGLRDIYIAQDGNNMNNWGVLQFYETLQKGENGQVKAEQLLDYYNSKTRTLSISKALGDTRVRAGCMVVVILSLGDIKLNNLMLVEKCKHTFNESEHFMDLTLRGGEFIA